MPPRTERTITDPDALLRDLGLSAARGYTIDDEEDSEGGVLRGRRHLRPQRRAGRRDQRHRAEAEPPTWRMDELGLTIREAADQITAGPGRALVRPPAGSNG